MSDGNKPVIVSFRQDLRLADHAPLRAAAETGRPVVAVYVLDDASPGAWRPGGAARWWLHQSLTQLSAALTEHGVTLVLRRGPWVDELVALVEETKAHAVYWHRSYEPWAQQAEQQLHEELAQRAVEGRRFAGYLLFEPEALRTQANEPFKVFTPFWKGCLRQDPPPAPRPAPRLQGYRKAISGASLASWSLLPTKPNWAHAFPDTWQPGEAGAHGRLNTFLQDAVEAYENARDVPGTLGTSRLSPYLHFGELSPRQVWHAVRKATTGNEHAEAGAAAFLRELGWREFSYHLLHHWPHFPDAPFRETFGRFPWRDDQAGLHAWQQGRTGIPLVDAGMRELWTTGWMHNRVRMVVASFLVKNLLIPWQAGEAWFWDTLVDADLGNNAAGWQWVAGCGADAAPYFRIFNPVSQSQKFDPQGVYLRRWVPELAKLPDKAIHAPWEAKPEVLTAAGLLLGRDYPTPIVDLKTSRQRALDAYQSIKAKTAKP